MLRRRSRGQPLSLFYAGDVHGSRLCWRKFVNAGSHYPADVLVMGGDLTGKALSPIVRLEDGTYLASVIGEERSARGDEELEQIRRAINANGMYPLVVDRGQALRLEAEPSYRDDTFEATLLAELRLWVEFADERLAGTGRHAFVIPGNDDPWSIDEVLSAGRCVDACDQQVRRVGAHELVSFGFSNRTPWQTPRELDEEEIYSRLKGLAEQLEDPAAAIFNVHVPPYDSSLDTAYEVDEELRYVTKGGRPREVATGSKAVRQVIEEVQPLLSLHGHIHESKGVTSIGRTVAINPGSDYGSGRLEGCLVHLEPNRVVNHYLVSG